MNPEDDQKLKAFLAERNALLEKDFDYDEFLAYTRKHTPNSPLNPEVVPLELIEASFHKARTAVLSLPRELRLASKAWLTERGMSSLDDGTLDTLN